MRRFLMTAAVAFGLCLASYSVRAEDAKSDDKSADKSADAEKAAGKNSKQVKGVLIDTMCGTKQLKEENPEKAAAGHKAACALKCGADGGYGVVSGKKLIKLDDAGNEKATAYLKKDNADTKVVVMGTLSDDGKTIKVTDIKAASDKEKKEKSS